MESSSRTDTFNSRTKAKKKHPFEQNMTHSTQEPRLKKGPCLNKTTKYNMTEIGSDICPDDLSVGLEYAQKKEDVLYMYMSRISSSLHEKLRIH